MQFQRPGRDNIGVMRCCDKRPPLCCKDDEIDAPDPRLSPAAICARIMQTYAEQFGIGLSLVYSLPLTPKFLCNALPVYIYDIIPLGKQLSVIMDWLGLEARKRSSMSLDCLF